MLKSKSILDQSLFFILALAAVVYIAVIAVNDGFMALDEYWVGITRYIPAQSSSLQTLVTSDDVKSPLQMMPMHFVAQGALLLGVTSPYAQYRIVIAVLGLFNFALLLWAFLKMTEALKLDSRDRNFLFLMLTFYFGASFALTRPMYESIAAPWLTLAGVKAYLYDRNEKLSDLLWGVAFGSMAFVLRQQLGFCALVFLILPLWKKNFRHLFLASGLGLGFFILSGIPDYFLRGKFHFSLLNLTVYNYEHGSDYGRKPLTFYPLVLFAMTFFPFFIKSYPWAWAFEQVKKMRSLWLMLFLFVFLHSLFPQKWERFLISVIPILIFLFFPFLVYLQKDFRRNRVRLTSLYALNGLLFVVASFFPPQKNLIEMSRYLDQHPEITVIHRVNNTPEWITEAFVREKKFQFIESNPELLAKEDWASCGKAFVLAPRDLSEYEKFVKPLFLKAEFDVNLIEQAAYRLNPKNNARRVRLNLYTGCR